MTSRLPPEISKTRKEIEDVYRDILALLRKRLRLISKIKKQKKKHGIPFKDQDQEKRILSQSGKFKNVFKEILKKKI